MIDASTMAQIAAWMFASLGMVKALSDFLNFVSKKTRNKTDDKIAGVLSKGLGFFSKILDYFTANSRPKK